MYIILRTNLSKSFCIIVFNVLSFLKSLGALKGMRFNKGSFGVERKSLLLYSSVLYLICRLFGKLLYFASVSD